MEIIGVGYTKDVEIGESFLHQHEVNMWDITNSDVFVYYDKGYKCTLEEWTRKTETTHSIKILLISEVTDEMRVALLNKGFTL